MHFNYRANRASNALNVFCFSLVHITDWLPTFYELAGGLKRDLPTDLDGISQVQTLFSTKGTPSSSVREEVFYWNNQNKGLIMNPRKNRH